MSKTISFFVILALTSGCSRPATTAALLGDAASGEQLAKDLGGRLQIAVATNRVFPQSAKDAHEIDTLASTGVLVDSTGTFKLSNGMYAVIDKLEGGGSTFGFLSWARKGGDHGAGGVNRAIDLTSFNGKSINVKDMDQAKDAIVDLLQTLPAGLYHLGFPRAPVLGDSPEAHHDFATYQYLGIFAGNPNDVQLAPGFSLSAMDRFFDPKYNEHSPTGVMVTDLAFIKDAGFRADITSALAVAALNGVVVHFAYADALDHCHLSVENDPAPMF